MPNIKSQRVVLAILVTAFLSSGCALLSPLLGMLTGGGGGGGLLGLTGDDSGEMNLASTRVASSPRLVPSSSTETSGIYGLFSPLEPR